MLSSFHRLQGSAHGYSLTQLFGLPTIQRYRMLVRKHVPQDESHRVLEIGCGVGSARDWFAGKYTGVDINPDYIERACTNFSGQFSVMDASKLEFEPNSFDQAVCIATGHHLSDQQLASMIERATTIAGCLHIVDAILPLTPNSPFKTLLFRMDRGQHVRTFEELREIVRSNARLEAQETVEGPLHDVCYLRASRT